MVLNPLRKMLADLRMMSILSKAHYETIEKSGDRFKGDKHCCQDSLKGQLQRYCERL